MALAILNHHPSEFVRGLGFNELLGLKILFINMPLRESARPPEGPIGVALLASRVRQYGASVSVIDLNAYRVSDELAQGKPNGLRWLSPAEVSSLLRRHFGKYGEPDIVALSGKITTLRWQEFVANACRQMLPDAFIVSGGGLATEVRAGLFSWIPNLDAVAHSEGDDIILVLAKEVLERRRHRQPNKAGLSEFLGEIAGRPRFLYHGDRPRDLDRLPFPAWDLFESDVDGNPVLEWYIQIPVWGLAANNSSAASFEMERSLTTVSSRGCPYSCAFCYRGAQGERNWGMRSADNIAAEARWLIERYQVDFIGFVDDNFAVRADRCQALPAAFADLGILWGTHLRLDEADLSRLGPMRQAGCIYGGFGAESASPSILKRMKKGGHILNRGLTSIGGFDFPSTMVEGIKTCRDLGVHANCTWIMGYPGETLADLKTSVAFILWQTELATQGLLPGSIDHLRAAVSINKRMFTATAYPGTEMFRDPVCQKLLATNFGLKFGSDGQPVVDEALRHYVEELDDATKVMVGSDGRPLNFGAMTEEQFLTARSCIDSGRIDQVLDL